MILSLFSEESELLRGEVKIPLWWGSDPHHWGICSFAGEDGGREREGKDIGPYGCAGQGAGEVKKARQETSEEG